MDPNKKPSDGKPRVNTGHLPVALDVLMRMSPKSFGMKLLEWHDGGGSGVYSVGSTLMANKQPDPLQLKIAIQELTKAWQGMTEGDRIETSNLATALKNRFQGNNMTQAQMAAWVSKNCKFAQKSYNRSATAQVQIPGQPAPATPAPAAPQTAMYTQQRMLPPQEMEKIISGLIQKLQRAVHQDPDPVANYNAVKKQVSMALRSALATQGAVSQASDEIVAQIMQGLGVTQPAQQGQGPIAPGPGPAVSNPARRNTRMPFE